MRTLKELKALALNGPRLEGCYVTNKLKLRESSDRFANKNISRAIRKELDREKGNN